MKQHRTDSGFALLLVFLMAACVAIMLYMEMPRVAFEAERQKELLLIDRGNQFKRAIQVFVTDTKNNPAKNYPASIDQLENFNNRRYLRRKYVDPMTGKDEWRLIHSGGVAGLFPDSVATQKPTQSAAAAGSTGGLFSNTLQSFDAPASQQQGGVSIAMRRRPSDGGTPGGSDSGGSSAGGSQGNNGNAGGGNTGSTGSMPGQGAPGTGGQPGGGTGSGGTGGTGSGGAGSQPCMAYIGNTCVSSPGPAPGGNGTPGGAPPGQPGAPPTGVPGAPPAGFPGAPPGGFPGSLPGLNGQPAQPGQPGQPGQPNQAQSAAAGIIQGILTSPRPGGMPTTNGGTIVGGGIAGVASKYEAEGIMVINDRTAINEWEYIFDSTKYRPPVNPLAGGPGTPANGSPAGAPGAPGPGGGIGGAGGIGNMNGGGAGTVTTGGRGGGQ